MPRKASTTEQLIQFHGLLTNIRAAVGRIALAGLELDERNCFEDLYTSIGRQQYEIARVLDRQNFDPAANTRLLNPDTNLARALLKESLTDT